MSLDFSFSPEQDDFRAYVRDFAQREIAPHVREWDDVEQLPTHDIIPKMGAAGLIGIAAPKAMGGHGKDYITLGICIEKALDAFARRGIVGEVVVGDNGSTDKSIEIAEALGARVVHQPVKGYGAAISAAAGAAQGHYLIMADADDSYDWSQLDDFIDASYCS